MNTISQNTSFQEELNRLNPAQQEAVNSLEGPVLVIAGPGTGKTQILAARIGSILSSEFQLAQPQNILCLTYTDAGSIAMRKRLLQFIGPDAYRVQIHTFHSFCNKVIQDNKELFGMHSLEPVSELEQLRLYRQLIDGFGPGHPLKRYTGDVYYEMGRLKELFRLMKNEAWSEEYMLGKIDEYLAELPLKDGFIYKKANSKQGIKAGDPNTKKIAEQTEKMNLLKAAVKEFLPFEKLMQKNGLYDYDDMILWVLRAFKNNEALLRSYQEQFQYFLVDEFQDTNGAQNEILKLLISYWELPNIFVVGDDDQSIYRFQGANIQNILQFSDSFAGQLKVIMLNENYRSSQHILDLAMHLIGHNQERLVNVSATLEKNLVAANQDYAASEVKPILREYYNSVHETVHVAMELEARSAAGEDLGEIAILYRNHRQAEDIARYLEQKNIPINIRKKTDILQSLFIKKIHTILRYLHDEAGRPHSREDLLFDILHFDFFGIAPLDIARFAADLRNKKDIYWREELKKIRPKAQNSLFDGGTDSARAMRRLSDDLEYWIAAAHNITLQQLFEKIVTRGGILAYVMRSKEKVWLMQELSTLFDFIKDESVKHPGISLRSFLDTLHLMEEYGLSLDINKTTFANRGVNFITAHSSKGQEFETVYVIGCQSNEWDKGRSNRGYTLPDNLVELRQEADEAEESRRLFYVALSRAKKELYISYSVANKEMKLLEKSRFVAELESHEPILKQQINLPDEAITSYMLQLMLESSPESIPLPDQAWIQKQLESYSLSVTHLSNYLRCPLSFYFQNLLRVPVAKSAGMSFGTAIHFALERYFRKMSDDADKKYPDMDDLLRDFEYSLYRNADSFTKEEYERRKEYGNKILPLYVNHYQAGWNKIVSTERNLRGHVDEAPVNGKLDKIEFEGVHCNVVDYKTGQFKNAKKKLQRPAEGLLDARASFEDKHGGDYWRQAVFYKILLDNEAQKNWDMRTAEFDFIEPTDREGKNFEKVRIAIAPEDITIVKGQILDTYSRIMRQEFDKGCGETDCKWCNFVKYYMQPDRAVDESLLQEEET